MRAGGAGGEGEMVGDLTSLEICAVGGGQALGLEQAGVTHEAVVELDTAAGETLRRNRGDAWKVIEDDVANVDGRGFAGLDLFSGGVPCPPFSIPGEQVQPDRKRTRLNSSHLVISYAVF